MCAGDRTNPGEVSVWRHNIIMLSERHDYYFIMFGLCTATHSQEWQLSSLV